MYVAYVSHLYCIVFQLKEMLMGLKSDMQNSALFEKNLNKIFEELSRSCND